MAVQTQIQTRRGTAASWTSTNPTLAAGEFGYETDTGKFKIGNGSTAWASLAYTAAATAVTYLFNATSGQTTFSGADANGLTLAYTVGAEQVYLNGVLQVRGSDYTGTNGTSIVLASGALTSDVLNIIAYSAMSITDTYTQAQADARFVLDSLVDAKGDLIAATANDTPARLAVGANGQVLTADSTASTGLAYTNKGWTLISQTTLSGASVTLSSIPQTFQSLKLVVVGMTNATADGRFAMRPNGAGTGFVSGIEVATAYSIANGDIRTQANVMRNNGDNTFTYTLDHYYQTINNDKNVSATYFYVETGGVNRSGLFGGMSFTSAITNIVLLNSGGNFSTGTAYLYGVA